MSEQQKEVYARFGLAIHSAQILEYGLVNALVYADLMPNRKPNHTGLDFDLFMDKHFKSTMGNLILNFNKHVNVPDDFGLLLLEARNRRNFLAHHYFRERALDFVSVRGMNGMIIELDATRELFDRTDTALGDIFRPIREKFGITDEVIESYRREIIASTQPDL